MRKQISAEEIDEFLQGNHIGMLGTHYRDGTILMSPVSYVWSDGGFSVGIPLDDIKTRHIKRDPRVSMCVAESTLPYRGVHIRAVGRLLDDSGLTAEVVQEMALQHLGKKTGEAYLSERDEAPGLVVRIEPGELRAWDFSDLPGLTD